MDVTGNVEDGRLDALARSLDERAVAADRRLRRLDADLAAIHSARDGASGDDEHDPEGDTLSAQWSRAQALRAAAVEEVERIALARAAMVAGEYGRCVRCGSEIPLGRLEALPDTRVCVTCAATS